MPHSLDPNPEKQLHFCVILIMCLIIVTLMGYSCTCIPGVLKRFAGSGPSNEMLSGFS